jgi:hypothetical protein
MYPTRCAECHDPIARGDTIVFVDDRPVHECCERHPGPWDGDPKDTPSLRLHALLQRRGTLTEAMLEENIDLNQLPPRIQDAFDQAMVAEGSLYSLLCDVASEHRDPEQEKRDHLSDLERRIAEHERKAREG